MAAFAALAFPAGVEAAAPGALPALRIVYTAESLGYIHPCSVCGSNAQGGLARRAALLGHLARLRPRPLIIAGPGEFYPDRDPRPGRESTSADAPLLARQHALARILHGFYETAPYAAVYVSPRAAAWLHHCGLPLPAGGIGIEKRPVTAFLPIDGGTAAVVFFPPAEARDGVPSSSEVAAVRNAAARASSRASILIGVSPWGMFTENALMQKFAGSFHIILGGGSGVALPGQASGDGAVPGPLWVRPDRMGRAVNVVDILSLPEHGTSWLDGIHYTGQLFFLNKEMPEDPGVAKLAAILPEDL